MKVIEKIEEIRQESRAFMMQEKTIGFVPTMGALHEGHLSLIREAADENDVVIVSIFVNPTQFNDGADFDEYPVDLDDDVRLAEEAGASIVFTPTAEEMYKDNRKTTIHVSGLTDHLCGLARGTQHFMGVCTVVTKLFNIVQPNAAYFGQKDAQQALVIQRMVADLNIPVRMVVCPIIRDEDGLAMSSRNRRLLPEERDSALCLRRALCLGRDKIREGIKDGRQLINLMAEEIIADPDVELDYLDIVDTETLEDVEEITDVVLIAGAIHVGEVRLIDNMLVTPDGDSR